MTKRVAIIGGSGGLGEAIALQLGEQAAVTIGYNSNRVKAEATAQAIRDIGGQAEIESVDICDPASVQAFYEATSKRWGGLDTIISASGTAFRLKPITEIDNEAFRNVVETDVLGSFHLLKYGIPHLQQAGGGSITMLLTTAVLRTIEHDAMSSVPKMAVEGLIRAAAREYGAEGIRVNGVAPGVFNSVSIHKQNKDKNSTSPVAAKLLSMTPLGRKGETHEIAGIVALLSSDQGTYITGQIIGVDGGFSA